MRVFEFHFNPKAKEDLAFDSFCYEPENVYERKLGSLFLVGEIKNALPQSIRFLEKFSSYFKREYYVPARKLSPETSLKRALKQANDYLEAIVKSGDVTWLGNLNLAILSVKNFNLNFAKAGQLNILLLRQGEIIDIGKKLEFEDIEPYPLKIFGKIVSGKLTEGDIVLVLTRQVFDFFSGQNLFKQILKIQPFEDKKLKAILKTKEQELLKISGICFLILFSKQDLSETKQQSFSFQAKPEKFSLKEPFLPFIKISKTIRPYFIKIIKRIKPYYRGTFLKEALLKLKTTRKKIQKLNPRHFSDDFTEIIKKAYSRKWWNAVILKKNAILVLSLILILALGFLLFQKQEHDKLRTFQATMTVIRQNISQAENYLALNNQVKAYEILKNALQEILPIAKERSAAQNDAVSLQNSIEAKLKEISKLEEVSEPKLVSEFDEKEFIPQKMVLFQNNLYLFSPLANNVYKVNLAGEKNVLEVNQSFNEAVVFGSQLLCFQKPNLVFFFSNNNWTEPVSLTLPYSNFNPKTMAVYRSNLYFLDAQAGEIIKYEAPLTQNQDFPQMWLVKGTKEVLEAKSMTIDGPIWILNKDNTVSNYYNGNFRKTITLDFFPEPENLSKISALYGLFYVLEPAKKRVIVLTEAGQIVKQLQSEKFDNLKDFAVSQDGRTIWLLNGVKIFEVSF